MLHYLQECIASELISTSQIVRYVLDYGEAIYSGLKQTDVFTTAKDVDCFCAILYKEMPSITVDEKSFITETSPMVELLHSLTGLVEDVTEHHPGICHLFTNFLGVISSHQVYSEVEQEAISELKAATNNLTSIPHTILQDIRLIGTSSTINGASGLVPGSWEANMHIEFGADDETSSPPASPDPWTVGPILVNGQTDASEIIHIRAPPYITFLVKNALETSWKHISDGDIGQTEVAEIPDSYKRIIHTAPEVCSRPTTFLYHLICASFGLLALSIDDLQERAVKEQNHASNMSDSADEVMMSLGGGQTGNISDSLKYHMMREIVARDGWKTWMWCFSGLMRVLQYWKTLSHHSDGEVFQQKWQLPVSAFPFGSVTTAVL